MKRLGSLFPLLMVLLLAMAAYWLNYIVSKEGDGRSLNLRHEPDTIMDDFTARQFGADGKLSAHLTAQRMYHFPDNQSAELVEPRITLLATDGTSHWSGQHGLVSEDNTRIDLKGQVRGVRKLAAGGPDQVLTTEQLTVLTEEQVGRSQAPVLYVEGETRVAAVGAEWDQVRGQLRLDSQVNATLQQGKP